MAEHMKYFNKRSVIIILIVFIGFFILFSGCILPDQKLFTKPAPVPQLLDDTMMPRTIPTTTSLNSGEAFWIRIDPIRNFETDASFTIIGSTLLVIRGTTNYPEGTMLHYVILEEPGKLQLNSANTRVWSNDLGANSFAFAYEMKSNPPGQYQLIIADPKNMTMIITPFNITSNLQYPVWIRMDPLDTVQKGKSIIFSGTTNLSAGTEITVGYDMIFHSCPPPKVRDKSGERTFCGGSCEVGQESSFHIRVVEGAHGVNSWNTTLNTTDWCSELYGLGASFGEGMNGSHTGQEIRFSPG
jgi:hypothetical protein